MQRLRSRTIHPRPRLLEQYPAPAKDAVKHLDQDSSGTILFKQLQIQLRLGLHPVMAPLLFHKPSLPTSLAPSVTSPKSCYLQFPSSIFDERLFPPPLGKSHSDSSPSLSPQAVSSCGLHLGRSHVDDSLELLLGCRSAVFARDTTLDFFSLSAF